MHNVVQCVQSVQCQCTAVAGTSHLVPQWQVGPRPGQSCVTIPGLTMPAPHSPQVSPWSVVTSTSVHHIARLVTTASDSPVVRNHDQAVIGDDGVVLCPCVIGFRESNFCLKVKWFSLPQNTALRSCVANII